MLRRTWLAGALALAAISTGLWASDPSPASAESSSATQVQTLRVTLPWGAGDGQVGMQPGGKEAAASGVPAITVASDGSLLLLDRVNRRVVRLGRDGSRRGPWPVAQIPAYADELAPGPDGAFAVYSQLRSRVWFYDSGQIDGEILVPRELRELLMVDVGTSRDVIVRTAHQETYRLGPSSAPQTLAAVLHSKREGAFELADGSGLATRLDESRRPMLLVLDSSTGRTRATRRLGLSQTPVLSARLVGVKSDIACVRLEHRMPSKGFQVRRSVTCIHVPSERQVFEQDLGPVQGPYVPRRSLAMGGDPVRLAFMQPTDHGLVVSAWDLPRTAGGGQ